MNKRFEVGKTYKTVNEMSVRIIAVDAAGDFPVVGLVTKLISGAEEPNAWTEWGRFSCFDEGLNDLVPEADTRELWINVYPHTMRCYRSKEQADTHANHARISCQKVTITVNPGEGL